MIDKTKILEPFFEEPNKEFHIRKLSRLLNINHTTIRQHLQKLSKEDLLTEKKTELTKNYKANDDNEIFKELKRSYNIQSIIKSGILDFLDMEFAYPTIVLFGSYARAENIISSDIDLFMLTETKKEINLEKYEKILKHPIELHAFNKKSYKRLQLTNPELVNNIANGIILRGQFWVFE